MKQMFFLLSLMFFVISEGKDLGVYGELFEIEEQDILEQIHGKLMSLSESGKLEELKREVQEKIKQSVMRPLAVRGVIHTEKERTFKYDPSIKLSKDLRDHKGVIFARKGDTFNPLDKISLSKLMLFIDGDDENHIEWAVSKLKENEMLKVILVNGSPLEVHKQLDRDIYFDQQGVIVKKLGITQVPAIVFQRVGEKVLTIHEELIKESDS